MNMVDQQKSSYPFLRCLIVLVLLLAVLPVHTTSVQAALQNVPRFESAPCMVTLPPGAVEGRDIQCGYLVVPLQYEQPQGPTIRLAVAIIKTQSSNPPPDPLVMMQGGPGGSTLDFFVTPLLTTSRLRANRDIILFDQRGTLYSQPNLNCPEYLDMVIATLNEDLSPEESDRQFQQALTQCHQRLVKQGIDLSAYNSIENANDVDALRQALGYDQINLYGVSYGTLLALHVMRQHPQGLRSVILNSVVPPQINFLTQAPQAEGRAFNQLFQTCAADTQCSQAYPNLEQVFYNLVDRLNKNPDHIYLTDPQTSKTYEAVFNGDTLISTIYQMQYVTELIPMLPRIIYNVRAGRYDFVERILSQLVFDRSISMGMYFSVLCAEDADFQPSDVNLRGLPSELKNLEENSGQSFLTTCNNWNVTALPSSIDQPVTSDVPTLVLTGAFDPITPPSYGQTAAQTLTNSYFFTFPWGGHGAALSGTCQDKMILRFPAGPKHPTRFILYC